MMERRQRGRDERKWSCGADDIRIMSDSISAAFARVRQRRDRIAQQWTRHIIGV